MMLPYLLLALTVSLATQEGISLSEPGGVRVETLWVRPEAPAQKRTLPSDEILIGEPTIVRLRLVAPARSPVFVCVAGSLTPLGYTVKWREKHKVWQYFENRGSKASSSSPGLRPLTAGLQERWVLLPPGSAIEWNLTVLGEEGEKQAQTIFVKFQEAEQPVEVFSEAYRIPAKKLDAAR